MSLLRLLRCLFFARHASRGIQASERASVRLEEAERRLRKRERLLLALERDVAKELGRVDSLVNRVRSIADATAEDFRDSQQALVQARHASEVLRTEHEADVAAIETLAARIKEIEALSDANIALSNHRRAQAMPGQFEREL